MAEITPRLFHLVYASTYVTGALQDKRVSLWCAILAAAAALASSRSLG